MYEFLEGFHQRMQLIGVVDALINRRNKKVELEHPIGDKEFENLIFSVLVFIMEKTLTEEEECTIKTISVFVEHVRRVLPLSKRQRPGTPSHRVHHQNHPAV